MPSGRIFRFIGFSATENAKEDCTFAPKKLMIGRIFAEVVLEAPAASIKLFRIIIFVVSMFSVTRRAGWAHPDSKSNTVFEKSSK